MQTIDISKSQALGRVVTECALIDGISSEVKRLFGHRLQEVRLKPELVLQIANHIEAAVAQGGFKKVDKLALLLDIYAHIFPDFGVPDRIVLTEMVNYLHENGKIVAPSALSRLCKRLMSCIFRSQDAR